jgi:hypothetical protein
MTGDCIFHDVPFLPRAMRGVVLVARFAYSGGEVDRSSATSQPVENGNANLLGQSSRGNMLDFLLGICLVTLAALYCKAKGR